ncbi:type II secretion system major pseudopilin GspG [Candidatus Dependentiae bacterium]|nr:type II secretion system major pseudopilin GspG [Candidatus Dependentiae bacterium]
MEKIYIKFKPKSEYGFTLIEILIVVAIIGILISIVSLNLTGKTGQARQLAAKTTIQKFDTALKMFNNDNGFFPSTEQGLQALIQKPNSGKIPINYPAGGYLEAKKLPKDPWGNNYIYIYPGIQNQHSFDIMSYGADGEPGGDDENKDIGNWEPEDTENK